jgi:hypothetical protein
MKKRILYGILTLFVILIVGGMLFWVKDKGVEILGGKDGWTSSSERVTVKKIKVKLKEISDLNTYEGEYTVEYGKEKTRELLDNFSIPLTKNSVNIKCKGIVKVGYDLNKMKIVVDHNKKIIYITLPNQKVMDNYIIWDTVKCDEKNNIFNPIKFEQYKEMITQIEKDGLKKTQENKIREKGEKNMKKILELLFKDFHGYKVEII